MWAVSGEAWDASLYGPAAIFFLDTILRPSFSETASRRSFAHLLVMCVLLYGSSMFLSLCVVIVVWFFFGCVFVLLGWVFSFLLYLFSLLFLSFSFKEICVVFVFVLATHTPVEQRERERERERCTCILFCWDGVFHLAFIYSVYYFFMFSLKEIFVLFLCLFLPHTHTGGRKRKRERLKLTRAYIEYNTLWID